ncbi:DUF2383 domain-containing protein [Bacillus niameyensis]|uniref:DUF2383 domain-containing protein n=1 Tax=Bacillus niameyensis TaxID=1522308 RepID=UPI0007846ED3|nr:DUF2383 domain-containing protein [Bacillus niameyensis]
MGKSVVDELNQFLEGNLMAVHAYEDYIEHMQDPGIKQILQGLQQRHKQHATQVAERIQNLGGVPVNDVGMKAKMVEFMKNFKGTALGTEEILKDAAAGEQRGIEASKTILQNDLDPESLQLVKNILSHDEKHIEQLHTLIQQNN